MDLDALHAPLSVFSERKGPVFPAAKQTSVCDSDGGAELLLQTELAPHFQHLTPLLL